MLFSFKYLGFPKKDCLRNLLSFPGSKGIISFLTKHWAFHIASYRGEPSDLILLVENSQSFPLGQFLLLDGSKLLMCCKRKVFQRALVGSRPLIINFDNRVDNMFIGFSILTPLVNVVELRFAKLL